jgi:peptidoglycan L-alanyl-D-glutamate endopeptidase CwlK
MDNVQRRKVMAFRLSQRSLSRLDGVNPSLVAVVKRAIEITTVDFGVTEGVRTLETQRKYVAAGKSQTMNSMHLPQSDGYGHAVDLVAYVGSQVSWENNLYDNIADAMKQAATELGVAIRWGAAWHIDDIRTFSGTMEDATNEYIDLRRSQGKRPFIDGPHFEMR